MFGFTAFLCLVLGQFIAEPVIISKFISFSVADSNSTITIFSLKKFTTPIKSCCVSTEWIFVDYSIKNNIGERQEKNAKGEESFEEIE